MTTNLSGKFLDESLDPMDIRRTWNLVAVPDQLVEVRILHRNGAPGLGRFTLVDAFERAVRHADDQPDVSGIYVTLNPVRSDASWPHPLNRIVVGGPGAKDADIAVRRWLLVDLDPRRPTKTNATAAEHQAAIDAAGRIGRALLNRGWPAPVQAISGNGAHLLYHLADWPNDPDSTKQAQRLLRTIAQRFTTETVDVDVTVFNASRISKVYGTTPKKGDQSPDRPWRPARILVQPDPLVPLTQIRANSIEDWLTQKTPTAPPLAKTPSAFTGNQMQDWLDRTAPQGTQRFLGALGSDLRWRLIQADDQHFWKGQPGHWLENARDRGRLATDLPLDRLDDQYSWHVRPMPKEGPYVLTMLDDATKDTLDRMISEGLPPTAAIETSDNRYQVWHRWPWAFPREKMAQLLSHLQKHYRTDPGANLPGHNGRLPSSRNWKRDPQKGIDRGGYPVQLVMTNPALTRDQAITWFSRFPVPEKAAAPITIPSGPVGQFDFADPRYQRMVAKQVPLLPEVWKQKCGRTQDASASGADMAIANIAVGLQLADDTIADILDPLVHAPERKAHGSDYITRTIAAARAYTDVQAPGVWGPRFDAGRQFPWLAAPSRGPER